MVYGNEPCHVRMHPDGRVDVFIGSGAHGQGLETTTAQLAAEHLGVHIDDVTVHQGDTESAPFGPGTGGSRSGPMIGAAVTEASIMLKEKVLAIAAHLLEAAPEDLEATEGVISVKGTPAKSITIKQVADTVYGGRAPLPHELDRTLEVMHRYDSPPTMWSNACHATTVEVDPVTGMVKFLRYVVAEDCGRMINPNIVDGQVHGGVAQGIGMALMEEYVNGRTDNLHDYLIPTVGDVPPITVHLIEDPEPLGPWGAKGVGEPALVATAPAILNAIHGATGVRMREVPVTPSRLRAAIIRDGVR
jgi:carbon-monoxide dehydrogenase large subunit